MRGLQNKGQFAQGGMRHNGLQHVLAATELGIAQVSPADHLVAVLMRATRVLGVVDMDRLQAFETHNAVEDVYKRQDPDPALGEGASDPPQPVRASAPTIAKDAMHIPIRF